jgi:hypothetical protein
MPNSGGKGTPELSAHNDILRRVESPRRPSRDRHAAAGQAQHHHRFGTQMQPRGQAAASIHTIGEEHKRPPSVGDSSTFT